MLHPSTVISTSAAPTAEERVAANNWARIASDLNDHGCAVFPLLTAAECREIAALYADESHFRSHVIMARHGFGKGIPIIEDRVYCFLEDATPLATLAPDLCVVIDSLSKRLAPSLSLGFIISPPRLRESMMASALGRLGRLGICFRGHPADDGR